MAIQSAVLLFYYLASDFRFQYQAPITLRADRSAQPQPGADHRRQGHPDYTTLYSDADLVGLDLLQVAGLTLNQVAMHFLTMDPGPRLPGFDRAFIVAKSGHDRLQRAAIRQQGNDQADHLWGRTQAVERCPARHRERLATSCTPVALLLLAVKVMLPCPTCPLAKQTELGQNTVCGSIGLHSSV